MVKKLLVAGVLAVIGALVWNVAPASAHHPEVAIEVCPGPENLQNVVDVTAVAFVPPPDWGDEHRINNDILVELIGEDFYATATGEFVAPNYSFTTRFNVPDAVGQTLTARVTAVDQWGPDQQYPSTDPIAETTVTVPVCNEMPTTTTSTTLAPTSTVAPSTTVAPTTTIATDVLPQTEDNAGNSGEQLAFSGNETGPVVLAAAGLIAIGTALLVTTRRRHI